MNSKLSMYETEINRAADFMAAQMRKGLSVESIFTQIKQSYGILIHDSLISHINEVLKKRK